MKIRTIAMVVLVGAALLPLDRAGAKEMTPLDIPMIGDIQMKKVGDVAPPFVLTDLEGKPFDLSKEASERIHLLVFWSIFCEPCGEEMPLIEKLYQEYKGKGLEVLGISMDGEPMKKSVQGMARQKGYTFRQFIDKLAPDESFVVADPFGVAGTPTLYLLDRTGKIVLAEVGRTSKEALEEAVKKALESK